ncbi:Protein kinase domain [Trinorchestia longiramus]|nr:Protein kinase domain [Trinorchestia longiramus]
MDRNFVPLSCTEDNKSSTNSSFQESMDEDSHHLDPLNNNSSIKNHNTPPDYSVALDDDTDEDDDDCDEEHPSKRVAIHEVNVSRYHKEFLELSVIGRGVFGSVYLVRHRLDGCLYAIKRSLKPVAGSSNERTALNEVYAHAVLGAHQHVVRYYSAWAEDDHMIIQNEYCNGGSLARTLDNYRRAGKRFTEEQIKTILLHLAKGLKFIHALHMVHLDVKPDNIFITCERSKHNAPNEDSADDGFEDDTSDDVHTDFTYKIGDLGHVTSVMNPKVEEGDCRYLPRELLQDDYSALPKVDIFALGLTLYEAASGCTLPLNGPEWQAIRNGDLPSIPGFSKCFQDLLRLMIHSDPKLRPSAGQLINHEVFNVPSADGSASKTRGQLRRELEAARLKNLMLEKQLEQAKYFLQHLSPSTPPCFSVSSADQKTGDDGSFSIEPQNTAVSHASQCEAHASQCEAHASQCEAHASQSHASQSHASQCVSPVPSLMDAETVSSTTASDNSCFTAGAFKFSLVNATSDLNSTQSTHDDNRNPSQASQSSHKGNEHLIELPQNCAQDLIETSTSTNQLCRSYHYNTRSQHQEQPSLTSVPQTKAKLFNGHSRLIGKRTNRSQSVI